MENFSYTKILAEGFLGDIIFGRVEAACDEHDLRLACCAVKAIFDMSRVLR